MKKDKTTAAILSLFLGYIGIHRFYLRQNGLGVLYMFLLFFLGFSVFLGIVDFFRFLFMDEEVFDLKYNKKVQVAGRPAYNTDFQRRETRQNYRRPRGTDTQTRYRRPTKEPKSNPYHQRGIEKYRNFDYYGAINDFVKALEADAAYVPVHFNLACAYSLTEQADQAFFHLSKAVEFGFQDFDRIREHDALAYIRIQEEYTGFAKDGFRLLRPEERPKEKPKEGLVTANPDLLEQLRQLGELRERELLTEEEFLQQKKKLLG